MQSRPIRARGLKPILPGQDGSGAESRPIRARGLKLRRIILPSIHRHVAPHTGSWIETGQFCRPDETA